MSGRFALGGLVVGLALGGVAPAHAQDLMGPGRMLLTDRDALLVSLPELVSSSITTNADWSPDGRYVLAYRVFGRITTLAQPPVMEESLVVWSDETRRPTTVWSQGNAQPGRVQPQWLHGADVALALVTTHVEPPRPVPGAPKPPEPAETEKAVLLRIDARRGTSRPLGTVKQSTQLTPSPSQPLAALWSFEPDGVIQIIRADGTVASTTRIPEGQTVNGVRWLADGRSLAALIVVPVKPGQVRPTWFTVQASGLKPLEKAPPDVAEEASPYPLRVREGQGVVAEGSVPQKIHPLWLEYTGKSEEPRALLAASGVFGKLSPRGDAVLYETGGAAWVAPLVRIPKEAFLQARAAARRQTVLSNAKQAGLGLLMYAQDYDETLPGQDKNLMEILLPYTKNVQVLAGLVYTFPGGKMADIPEPSKTELGYWTGEGGRAYIYADGHVVWKKDGEQ